MSYIRCDLSGNDKTPDQVEFEVNVTGYSDNGHNPYTKLLIPFSDMGYEKICFLSISNSASINGEAVTIAKEYTIKEGITDINIYAGLTPSGAEHGKVGKAKIRLTK